MIFPDRVFGKPGAHCSQSGLAIGLMCWHAWGAFASTTRSGLVSLTPLETPLSLPFLSVAVGMSLFVLEIFVDILKDVVGLERAVGPDPGLQH